MEAAPFVAILIAVACLIILCLAENKEQQDRARERRMAEHRMNARLLRLDM